MQGDVTAALDSIGTEGVCDLIVNGDTLLHIASLAGGSKASLIRWIAKDADRSARVRDAMVLSAATFDEKAELVLERAGDPFELSRARELASHYRWRASKRNPQGFGDKLETLHVGDKARPVIISSSDAEL